MRGFGKSSGGSAFGQSHAGFGSAAATDSGSNLCYWSRPADCSGVSDPAVVVSFKGLQKKDDTTKVRALEELMAYVQKHPFEKDGGPEDAVLDAWAVVFPRLIFDNCNRVRELSATIMGLMVLHSRHRVNHRFNHILAPWYAAGGDSVSSVAKAAQVSMSKLIATPEKHVAFATKIQKAVLRFVVDAFSETRETLSDERATTPEDMDAKYYRVVNASLSLVCALLRRVSPESRASAAKEYAEVLALDKIWTHINSPDSSVRRAACTLFQLSTRFFPDSIKAQKSAIKKILLRRSR